MNFHESEDSNSEQPSVMSEKVCRSVLHAVYLCTRTYRVIIAT